MLRRKFLQIGLTGMAATHVGAWGGIAAPAALATPALAGSRFGRARNVIVMFCWGGMSHIDTFDMKPQAGSEIRGEFKPVSTSVPGIQITEHLPLIGKQMHHLALVRSVSHQAADHRKAAYWNLTGHAPTNAEGGVAAPDPPSRKDWPCIGSQVAIALRDDQRYQQVKRVTRVRPEELDDHAPETAGGSIDWDALRRFKQVSLSTEVLGAGRFPVGSFAQQDGFTNRETVELIGMIGLAVASSVPVTRSPTGPRADFSRFVVGDSTAGDWGSDTHGRSGHLYLVGDGEKDRPHAGFGSHANKFISFDLAAVRRRHFQGTARDFVFTCRVGMNGAPAVPSAAAGRAGVWLDGKRVALSQILSRDSRGQTLEVVVRPHVRYLTLAMLNGDQSTAFDDITLRDAMLHEVEGELPAPTAYDEPAEDPEVDAQEVTEELAASLPRTISIPYPLADRGILNGQFGGFLGLEYDPAFVHPGRGRPYNGISPGSGTLDLNPHGVSRRRLAQRSLLLDGFNDKSRWAGSEDLAQQMQACQNQAMNMLLAPDVRLAFDLDREAKSVRAMYGDHVSGQSALLARRLTDAGVPLVTVNLSVGDLNGATGDNWDTHGDNFNRLKRDLLPPWDRAASALIQDLVNSGRIDDTLVVFLTEFGRTPRINGGAGRDHFPSCYSVLFAGAGVRGGIVLGKSDKMASRPIEAACAPADIHATIFHALGIRADFRIHDQDARPLALCEGQPLPIFG